MCIVFSTRWQITGRARRAGKFVRCGLELERIRNTISAMIVGKDGQEGLATTDRTNEFSRGDDGASPNPRVISGAFHNSVTRSQCKFLSDFHGLVVPEFGIFRPNRFIQNAD